jgi:chemotaxis family two-component system response regulator Rcp1
MQIGKSIYQLLIADDNPAEIRLMQEAIKEANLSDSVELITAFDGEEACECIRTQRIIGKPIDLALLDLNMPRMNGKEVLDIIKKDPDLAATPVFMVTNSDYRKDMIECYRLGADGYFQKPNDFKKLVDFFISIRQSILVRQKVSIFYIEKTYDELRMAV